jgi:GT2 family glycosyltransferase
MPPSPLLLIVGMHRSGTSLLGSILRACGIALPGPLLNGDHNNPEGYFERADITALQEQLLINLERWWPSPRGMEPLPQGWLATPWAQQTLAQLIELLEPEARCQSGPWAIKDPRSSLLLPLWQTACSQLSIPLQLLLVVRDPAEVMVSLVRRDQQATGMDGWRAQRLWWHHNAQVLLNGKDLPLQVISYSHWFDPELAQAQLRRLTPNCSNQQQQEALAAIKPQYRRSKQQPLPTPLAAPVRALHQRLEQLSIEGKGHGQLQQWLAQQPGLSALAPLPRLRSNLKRSINTWRGNAPLNRVADHPWGYLVQMVCGSQGPVAEHLLASWLEHGFREFELARFATLPGPRPPAEPWTPPGEVAKIQVRGGDLNNGEIPAWLQSCPLPRDTAITAMAYGAGDDSPVLLNLADLPLQPGSACAGELLRWAQLDRVWDPNPNRVQVLRQFGIKASWLQAPAQLPAATAAETWAAPEQAVQLQVRGGDLNSWSTHAWLQHCPIEGATSIAAVPFGAANTTDVLINLSDLTFCSGPSFEHELRRWTQFERVWDLNPNRVQMLRHFGVKASLLRPNHQANAYLQPSAHTWVRCAAQLGLANPALLARLGRSLCLGRSSAALDGHLEPPLLGLPGFHELPVHTPEQAQLLATWLQGCLRAGLELVVFQHDASPADRHTWTPLVQADQIGRAPILVLNRDDPIAPAELLEELEWYRKGCPPPLPCTTPTPSYQVVFDQRQHTNCSVAVCISLYNYGTRIMRALESVRAQQQISAVELIVVDDASSDDSTAVVKAWMQKHQSRFSRCLLLQHEANGGLASARNTAFAAAQSPWCFVLDADNQLDPLALAHCSELANSADARCAVIHSLIRVQPEAGCHDSRQLISDIPWNSTVFQLGNYIDAMALVRREAWQAVGGYTHIPGGWEDFDFWCSLIDGGWHGVLCPQVLATYTSHGNSMRNSNTNQHTYRLSRLLQARHPWLALRQAQNQAIWASR